VQGLRSDLVLSRRARLVWVRLPLERPLRVRLRARLAKPQGLPEGKPPGAVSNKSNDLENARVSRFHTHSAQAFADLMFL
jgi:hypothetical protein